MEANYCKICHSKPGQYYCPRCNIVYCSVDCYKSQQHLQCSEGFYRENVVQELMLRKKEEDSATSTKAMLAILQRIEKSDTQDEERAIETDCEDEVTDSDDDGRECALAARLSGINLDDTGRVWERLTNGEEEEFLTLVENGDIINVLPNLVCWWTQTHKVDLVQPADTRSQQEQKLLVACPRVWEQIPSLKDLFAKEPSPTVRFNIANTLAAYSFVYQYFHGDIHENALDAAECLLSICLNLKKNIIFDSESMAVESVTNECINEKLPADNMTTVVLKYHVHKFIAGPKQCGKKFQKLFLLAALSDMRSLFIRANGELKKMNAQQEAVTISKTIPKTRDIYVRDLPRIESTLVRRSQKKLEFFLAYVCSVFW